MAEGTTAAQNIENEGGVIDDKNISYSSYKKIDVLLRDLIDTFGDN